METLAKARGLNEKVIKQLQVRTKHEEQRRSRCRARLQRRGPLRRAGKRSPPCASSRSRSPKHPGRPAHHRGGCRGLCAGIGGGSRSRSAERAEEPAGTAASHHFQWRDGTVGSRQTGRRRPVDHAAGRCQPDEGPETAGCPGLRGPDRRQSGRPEKLKKTARARRNSAKSNW